MNTTHIVIVLATSALLAGCQLTGSPEQVTPNGISDEVGQLARAHSALSEQLTASIHQQEADMATLRAAVANLQTTVADACNEPAQPAAAQCTTQTVVMHGDRMVVGRVERVRVDPPGFIMDARIDTGADSSSIHAERISEFERDGKDWVRFDIVTEQLNVTLERPVRRHVRVFQQSDKAGTRRPVVDMRILIGNISDTFEFTLADRSHLEHNMILGRNFLTDLAVVDVGQKYVQRLPTAQTSIAR